MERSWNLIANQIKDERIKLCLVNLLYFAAPNTVRKTVTARYPFILTYAFVIASVKLMQKMQIKIQLLTCQIWSLVSVPAPPPRQDKYMT